MNKDRLLQAGCPNRRGDWVLAQIGSQLCRPGEQNSISLNMDPRTLLTSLQQDDDRTVQRFALQRLCMILVTADSVERCFYVCPPWIFMPALCRIFLDEHAPDDVLEITAHAITYYLEVSADCTQWIVAVDGAVKAFFSRLEVVEVNNRKRRDFAEQCVEVLEVTCTRQSGAVLKACGDFSWILAFILNSGYLVHKDTLHSAMFVVSRLCGKMEPHDSRIDSCVEALSILFKHEDHQVSDAALRCFVSLADRFMRRGVDPAPLAEHGLTAELVSRLAAAGGLAPGQSSTGTPQPSCGAPPAITSTPGSGFSSQVSTIVSLLSALFRGSPIVTRDLLRTPLLDAIERAVQGDDRCCLDTMRLVDLLFVLLFEGRAALPRFSTSSASGIPGLGRLHRSVERSHRQLISCIKRKNTDGLIDAIDAGAFDVNFMDDVGGTLLIWASAFGTQEMVEFLCERGCDVNRGQCPPLLIAAFHGQPQVVKTLLKNGADPCFRDEDGMTPLDHARDFRHNEVVSILQSPEKWMCPVDKDQDKKKKETRRKEEIIEPRDHEMAPVYLKRFLPIFAQNFQKTIVPPVRKASLALICKMVHHCPGTLLKEICSLDVGQNLPIILVEITSAVLHHEDDEDGQLLALQMIDDLVEKGCDLFMDHLEKLGVINMVSGLAGTASDDEREEDLKTEQVQKQTPHPEGIVLSPGLSPQEDEWPKRSLTLRRIPNLAVVTRAGRFEVRRMARKLHEGRFEAVESIPRGILLALRNIATRLECAWELHTSWKGRNGDNSWIKLMKAALEDLTVLLKEEKTISPHEMSSSGLIQALLTLLCNSNNKEHGSNCTKVLERIHIFKAAFKTDGDGGSHLAEALVRKLISVLESFERLPLYQYNTPGTVYNLQVLTRRLQLRLERAPGEMFLRDITGLEFQMEPLATTESLEHYILNMAAMQWFEYDRGTLAFVRKVRDGPTFVWFDYQHDFDDNGIIYWIGTNARTAYEWINPAAHGLVTVTSSAGWNLPNGYMEDILSRDSVALNCHTDNDVNAWFAIDLGLFVIPKAYTLRHAEGYRYSALRNWLFQVSKDGHSWLTLCTHTDDDSLDEPGSTATWPLEPPKSELQGWRHIRLKQMGRNASELTYHLSLSGFELYGAVTAVCEDGSELVEPSQSGALHHLTLTLKVSRLGAVNAVELPLTNPKATIFSNVQKLLEMTSHGELKVDKLWTIWEPTYTIVFSEMNTSEKEEKEVKAECGGWRSKICPSMQKPSGGSHFPHPFPSPILNLPFEQPQARAGSCQNMCSMEDVLQLLRLLHDISSQPMSPNGFSGEESGLDFIVPVEEFTSQKLTTKILKQIEEPLALACGALPDWCEKLSGKCPFLIPFKTRQLYFNCTAFGVTRTVVWIQNRLEASVRRARMTSSSRQDDPGELQVGRLKHERVEVPLLGSLMDWAENVMHIHAAKKSVLEIKFIGEEGSGVGPTLWFYAFLVAEFQRKSLGIWICDDDLSHQVDFGDGLKPPGYDVQHSAGLFPSPLPQDSDDMYRVKKLFYFFGIFLAKCIQDNRLVDIPLSRSFFKLMCRSSTEYTSCKDICDCSNYTCSDISSDTLEASHDDIDVGSEDDEKSEFVLEPPKPRSPAWFHKVLTWENLEEIWPQTAQILRELKDLAVRRRQVLGNRSFSEDARNTNLQDLVLKNSTASGSFLNVEDLGLTFQYYPSSKVYGFSAVDLKPNGEDEMVTVENAEEYVDLMLDFCLHSGIRKQMEAFRDGFNQVFPMEKLILFTPEEVQLKLCGDQCPSWTAEDINNYTEPMHGYTRESPAFLRFVNVLCKMDPHERKAFLQFTTGCSSLPLGGLSNLQPRLTIMRNVDACDRTFPSVNTCFHSLWLPDYSSEDIMRERLLSATMEEDFHLN
uniref:E3 ubiquitin-protein ligase HECTD1-like n=1 Tax=Myxine glutinosa TaxID=7769 RepID=UPI00358EE47C